MPRIPVNFPTATAFVTRQVMEDTAWQRIIGLMPANGRLFRGKPVEARALDYFERTALGVVAGYDYTRDGELSTGDVVKVLMVWMDCDRGKVMTTLRNLEEGYFLRQEQHQDEGRVLLWQLYSEEVRAKLERLGDVLEVIDEVLAAQRAKPDDTKAGMELLAEIGYEDIYYNLAEQRDRHRRDKKR